MLKYTGINHLAMVTGDMDATIRFWRDLLEMRLVAGLGRPGFRHYFFEISSQDMLAFFEWTDVEKISVKDHGVPVKGPVAFDHISFGVERDKDLWEVKNRLEAAGIWVSEIIDHGFIHSIYTFDPNNIPIEFSAPVKGVDVRKNTRMKDHQPVAAALEGADPMPGHWPKPKGPLAVEKREIFPGEGQVLAE